MTCGIYKLNFEGTDKVYIGQSHNIEKRFIEHKKVLISGLASIKMLDAYALYGMPSYEILIECEESELDSEEEAAIEVWDSYNNGFNSRSTATGGGYGSYGDLNGRSKYTNLQIEQVFKLLLNKINVEEIISTTKVAKGTIHGISKGTHHTWLQNKFPTEYTELLSRKYTTRGTAAQRSIFYPTIIDTLGNEYNNISNVREFARLHNLDSGGLNRLLNSKTNSHRGWKRK